MRFNIFAKKGLIVSCQALEHEPLFGGDTMTKMAVAAVNSGAIGIRTNGLLDIRSIKQRVDVPIIGLVKREIPGSDIFITPTMLELKDIITAGADVIAMDITNREGRWDAVIPMISYAHKMNKAVMADISTLEEGLAAERLGADCIGTTLSGYTPYSRQLEGPDFELLEQLCDIIKIPIAAEGRIWSPEEAVKALKIGASYVVVGSAITRPQMITSRFTDAIKNDGPYRR